MVRHVIRSADRRIAIEAADLSEAIDRISQGPCAVAHGVVEEEKRPPPCHLFCTTWGSERIGGREA